MGQDTNQWVSAGNIRCSDLPSEPLIPVIGKAFEKDIPKDHLLVLECLSKAMATPDKPVGDQMIFRCTNYIEGILKIVKEQDVYFVYVKSS
ncbi:MAG: hypothetical protein ACT6FE_01225 [Methanosarcinaceae archaeon]